MAHSQAFAARMPPAEFKLERGVGLDHRAAQRIALCCNAELNTLRASAEVAAAVAELSGQWADPELGAHFGRIYEGTSEHPWLAGASLGFTLPITGRLGLERALAESEHAQALLRVRQREAEVLDQLATAWVTLAAASQREQLRHDFVARLLDLEHLASQLHAAQVMSRVHARAFALARSEQQAELRQASRARQAAAFAVRALLGMPPQAELRLLPTLEMSERVPPAEQLAQLPLGPRVLGAVQAHAVAERQLELAVRKQWPDLRLQPGWDLEDGQPRGLFGLTLPLPLWNGNAQEIAKQRAERAHAAMAVKQALETATHALAQSQAQLRAATEQEQLAREQWLPLAQQQLADVQSLAAAGQMEPLLLLDALARGHAAQDGAIAAALARSLAVVDLNALFWPDLRSLGEN